MDVDHTRIQELVDRPSESLAVEIKTWIDPDSPEGQAKIVRSVLALRNNGGGYLVVGINDESLLPDLPGAPPNIQASFHVDKIQGLIGRFASEPFEVGVGFVERDGAFFPVLVVPTGIRTPVAAKADLIVGDKKLVTSGDVYVRTLRSNNTPSTAKASWKDWGALVDVCFDNREADVGRFIRVHLGAVTPGILRELASEVASSAEQEASMERQLEELLNAGEKRFYNLVNARALSLPDVGWWEVGLIIDGEIPPHRANSTFLGLLDASNPNLTGWPVWLDSRSFADPSERPFVFEGKWESLIVSLDGFPTNIDFQQIDPAGNFYLRWALQDDLSNSPQSPIPRKAFDFGLPVIRSAEAIAVGLAFAKAMGCNPDDCALQFAFRWTGLQGRELVSWAQQRRKIRGGRFAQQDRVTVFQSIDLDTPLSALGGALAKMLKPLYELFDGFELDSSVIEELTTRLMERRL